MGPISWWNTTTTILTSYTPVALLFVILETISCLFFHSKRGNNRVNLGRWVLSVCVCACVTNDMNKLFDLSFAQSGIVLYKICFVTNSIR
jgi:hypothetical protein